MAGDIHLSSKNLSVILSASTGRVTAITDGAGARYLTDNEDVYDLEGTRSSETKDVVTSAKIGKKTAVFDCANSELGISLSKKYSLIGNMLVKTVAYKGSRHDKLLLKVSSKSTLDPALVSSGYYYTPIDDGCRVGASPFVAGSEITEPTAWLISFGSFVFYAPKRSAVFTHYRYKVNGRYVYNANCNGDAMESLYIPGGAVTALGKGFIDRSTALSLESHYVILNGDPRDYHKHIYNQPPYTEFRNARVPEWFKNVRMFYFEGDSGTGKGLIEDRDGVAREIKSLLKLLPSDVCLMVFFNHWSMTGDYPYKGNFRYLLYDTHEWSKPVPVERLKENIAFLKSLSPRVKIGGYVYLSPAQGTYPYEQHPEWLVHNKQGKPLPGVDGVGPGGYPDFSSGYRPYVSDQLKHMVTDLGFDWIHADVGLAESVNWSTSSVVQTAEGYELFKDLSEFCRSHNAVIVQNQMTTSALWADGSYFEVQQPDRWEKLDWRIMAAPGYLSALQRTCRPGTWVNLVYGTNGAWGMRNAFSGMRGWMRNWLTFWRDIPHGLAHEKVIDELLETKLCDARVSPSWWRLETDKLEAEALQIGEGVIVPVILHGDKAGKQTISLDTRKLGYVRNDYTFSFDFRLSPPVGLDVFKPVPSKADYIELTDFNAAASQPAMHKHTMALEPLRNYYHVLTQVPAWVYSCIGSRTSFLLPENRGVSISGRLRLGADSYQLSVRSKHESAEILAYVPSEWKGVAVAVNGKRARPDVISLRDGTCLLLVVGSGDTNITISKSLKPSSLEPRSHYKNPQEKVWMEAAERMTYSNLEHRAFDEGGRTCLALREATAGQGGSVSLPIYPAEKAGGFSIESKGANSGETLAVTLKAGSVWTYAIKDDFTGWRRFDVRREQMSCVQADPKWVATTQMSLGYTAAAGHEMVIGNIHLLPARAGDILEHEAAVKRAVAAKTDAALEIDGLPNDACWRHAAECVDFVRAGSASPSEAKSSVRVAYDDSSLYLLFECQEPLESLGELKPRDTQIWNDDHVEIFIDPFKDRIRWFHLLVDPAGTIEDARYANGGRDETWNGDFEVSTYLNWKASWTAEFRIPFSTLGKIPREGDVWRINFARKDLSGEFSNWATSGEWLDPEGFGELQFGDKTDESRDHKE